jgi:hypothetical protein
MLLAVIEKSKLVSSSKLALHQLDVRLFAIPSSMQNDFVKWFHHFPNQNNNISSRTGAINPSAQETISQLPLRYV